MRVLVTGGAGFIGSHISDTLLQAGHAVTVLDNLSSGRREQVPAGAEFIQLDVNDAALAGILAELRPQAVLHQAAQIDVRRSMSDPAFDARTNVQGTLNLVLAAVSAGVEHFLFAGTGGAVYGDTDQLPTPETHFPAPASIYGASKLAAENYLRVLAETHGLRWASLRYANVYGPRQDPHGEAGVVAIFCERMLEGREVVIFGDGDQTRDYVYVGDVARANLLALEGQVRGIFNIGTGRETTVNQLHQLLSAHLGVSAEATHAAERAGEQRRSVVDVTRARTELGWTAAQTIESGLAQTADHFRSVISGGPGLRR